MNAFGDIRDELTAAPEFTELRTLTGEQALNLADILGAAAHDITEAHGDDLLDLFWEIEFLRIDVADLADDRYQPA